MNDHDSSAPVRPYEADGIRELDNNLPSWWVGLFVFTVIFSALYLAYVHMLGGPSIAKEFADSMASVPTASSTQGSGGDSKDLNAMLSSSDSVAAGKAAYQANCAPCHGQNGEGTIGPNLTDKFWLNGGAPEKILSTITNGVVEKGMPAWGPVLGEKKAKELTSFVVSLKGSNPANGKAPQGTEE
jgi:cytochrome c oxidase cbb3-type subunit III